MIKAEEYKINELKEVKEATAKIEAQLQLEKNKEVEAARPSPEFLAALNASAAKLAPAQLQMGLLPVEVFTETRKIYTKFFFTAIAPMEERWAQERRAHLKQKKFDEAKGDYRNYMKL
jgi:hypothetical protein